MIIATGFIGSMVQANSISLAITTAVDVQPWIIGVAIALLVGLVIMGGQQRIRRPRPETSGEDKG